MDGAVRVLYNAGYINSSMPKSVDELKRIINESEVTQEDDNQWPEPVRGVPRARRVARRGGA